MNTGKSMPARVLCVVYLAWLTSTDFLLGCSLEASFINLQCKQCNNYNYHGYILTILLCMLTKTTVGTRMCVCGCVCVWVYVFARGEREWHCNGSVLIQLDPHSHIQLTLLHKELCSHSLNLIRRYFNLF